MEQEKKNFCQVSLARNIPIIIENYYSFKKFYRLFNIFIICPKNEINEFRTRLNFEGINIIDEDTIISFKDFSKIFEESNGSIKYKDSFKERLGWYYQQILKISFVINFINSKKENIIIWDADTVILKKICFFKNNKSVKYGNFFEYHKDYYETNKEILREVPKYFISFLNQFIAISINECQFFLKNYFKYNFNEKNLGLIVSKLIFKSVFNRHKIYKGSLFSEYELLGQSNYIFDNVKQKPILFLRFGLNGKLTIAQKIFAKKLGYKHVTYEHGHISKNNSGILNQKQSWIGFLKIIFKNFTKFYLKCIIHEFMYNLNKLK